VKFRQIYHVEWVQKGVAHVNINKSDNSLITVKLGLCSSSSEGRGHIPRIAVDHFSNLQGHIMGSGSNGSRLLNDTSQHEVPRAVVRHHEFVSSFLFRLYILKTPIERLNNRCF
jgi:hypothetical protein